MIPVPFRHQPAFRALIFAVVLAAVWTYGFVFQEGWRANLAGLALDLVLLFLSLQAGLFLYAQFTLPVRTIQERLQIWNRLLLHFRNAHGPAAFVQNGRIVQRRGESGRSGPGLLWIDTSSAAMTRSAAGPKQVLGPGIHFLAPGEKVGATFSLHTQTYSVGPGQDEAIFEKLPDHAGEEHHRQFALVQARRQMVSGLTRDGNEVIPEIRVTFRLDGAVPRPDQSGSRFGFRRESIERAARGEGVNVDPVSAQRSHVAWNQLPGLLAVDLWREYLAKFTLDELFSARFDAVPEVLQPEQPAPVVTEPVAPLVVRRTWTARLLWRLNNSLENWAGREGITDDAPPEGGISYRPPVQTRRPAGRDLTALEVVAHMVRARMTQAVVPILDDCGRYLKGHAISEEFKRLQERGVRILDVTLGGYRFDPAVEELIVQQWRSGWLANAMSERRHVEQLELLAAESGKQLALLEHADALGRAVQSDTAESVPSALRSLLQASHNEILTDERLHGQGSAELDALFVLAKWVESSGNE